MQEIGEPAPMVLTVSQLNRVVRDFLEDQIAPLWISGEISNFTCPSSGHWYFTLKDATAAIRCAFFQPRLRGARFVPENGMHGLIHGKVSVYETRGDYQFIVDAIEPVGIGTLQKAFEQLKATLQAEGLFSAAHKKPLPYLAKKIAIVTSPTGAAIRDILSVLHRRFPLINIIIYPTAVQGSGAASEIVKAIEAANRHADCDLIILARGGGSLEDLWPFNEESVARAIFNSTLPIVSAVGHEIDFTIADFVADHRAPTPSAAAELISPDQTELLLSLEKTEARLMQLLDYYLQKQTQQLDQLDARLQRSMKIQLQTKQQQLAEISRALNAISPLATLDRGYALIQTADMHTLISSIHHARPGENITARLRDGHLHCQINFIAPLSKN